MKLVIPGRLPGLNDMIDAARTSRYKSAELKQTYTDLVAWYAKSARLSHVVQADFIITWYEKDKKRDKDNVMAGQKFLFDGLVKARILKNDGWKQVGDITHRVRVDHDNPRIEIEIIEIKAS